MSHHCPTCQRILYNRRLKICGFCGAEIPENLRFTPAEIEALDRQMAELEQQRQQRERARAKEEEEARRRNSGDAGYDFGGLT